MGKKNIKPVKFALEKYPLVEKPCRPFQGEY